MSVELVGLPKLLKKLSSLEMRVFPKAATRALNRTTTVMRTSTVKDVAKTMGVKQKDVRSKVKARLAKPSPSPSASLSYKGKGLNLIHFKASQNKKGVAASPWGNRKTFTHGFITTIGTARLVMVRQKQGGALVSRLPIRPLLGPGVAKTAMDPEVAKGRAEIMRTYFPTRFAHELKFLVSKL